MDWTYKEEKVLCHDDLLPGCTDFVYLITYESGKKYIGKKTVKSVRKLKPTKAQLSIRKNYVRKELVELPFVKYEGSSKETFGHVVASKEILYQCSTKKAATYIEAGILFNESAIFGGEYLNKSISGKFFDNDLDGLLGEEQSMSKYTELFNLLDECMDTENNRPESCYCHHNPPCSHCCYEPLNEIQNKIDLFIQDWENKEQFVSNFVKVDNTILSSTYKIRNELPKIFAAHSMLSFDCETRSVYEKELRTEAKTYLKDAPTSDSYYKQARIVSESSGLSFPSIVKTTHFILGISKNKVYTVICKTPEMELFIWNLVADYAGMFLVHNSGFDFKICKQRTGKLPKNFTDTQLLAKCLINHVDIWKSKVGLKELVGDYYPPSWALYSDYEPADYKNPDFLKYCGWDGSAVWTVYELMKDELKNEKYISEKPE